VPVLFIIDRFEGDWAILEVDRVTFNIPKVLLPEGAREGDVVEIDISINEKATARRRQRISELADDLFEE
jgi:hypothetical protein